MRATFGQNLDQGFDITQTQIQALTGQRMYTMRRIAHQRHAWRHQAAALKGQGETVYGAAQTERPQTTIG